MSRRLSLLLGALLLAGFTQPQQTKSLDPAEAARQGRELVAEILARNPEQNYTNTGVLKFRAARDEWTEVPVKFEVRATATNWQSIYEAAWSNRVEKLLVIHTPDQFNAYFFHTNYSADVPLLGDIPVGKIEHSRQLNETQLATPFAASDFLIFDLGLEFLHWPGQKILKTEPRKTLSCKVLESTNPHVIGGAYSRVISWIDTESLGLIHADAYDNQGRWLKEFDPKSVKESQLMKMEMYNRQTHSRSQIEFDTPAK